jgi:hypothetical protein
VEEEEAQSGGTRESEKQDVLEGTREAQTMGEKPEPEGEKAAGEETQPESSFRFPMDRMFGIPRMRDINL